MPKIHKPDNAESLGGRMAGDYPLVEKDIEIKGDYSHTTPQKSKDSYATIKDIQKAQIGWHPTLASEDGLTTATTGVGSVSVTGGSATLSSANTGTGAFKNSDAFGLDFEGVWEVQATFTQLGNKASNTYRYIGITNSASTYSFGAIFGDEADADGDYGLLHIKARVNSVSTYYEHWEWAESREYNIRITCDGTTIRGYADGRLIREGLASYYTSQTIDYIDFGATSVGGNTGDVIVTDIHFTHSGATADSMISSAKEMAGRIDHSWLDGLTTDDDHTQYFLLAGETTNAQLHSGADLIVYSDAGSTEKARIDGATGNITTAGTVDGVDVANHAHTGSGTGGSGALTPVTVAMAGGAGSYIDLSSLTTAQRTALGAQNARVVFDSDKLTSMVQYLTYWFGIPMEDTTGGLFSAFRFNAYTTDGSAWNRFNTGAKAAALYIDDTNQFIFKTAAAAANPISWTDALSVGTSAVTLGVGLDMNTKTISTCGNISMYGAATVDGVDVSAHDTATTGVHGAGANTLLHTGTGLALTGGTLTGNLEIDKTTPYFIVDMETWPSTADNGGLKFYEGGVEKAYIQYSNQLDSILINDGVGIVSFNSGNIVLNAANATVDGVDVSAHDVATTGVHGAGANTLLHTGDVDDTPVNGATTAPVSSNWAYDHVADNPHFGYALDVGFLATNPLDSTTYYGGMPTYALTTAAGARKVYIPVSGTLTVAYVWAYYSGTVASDEDISLYIRLNDTSDTLIETANAGGTRNCVFNNSSLSISVSAGDFIELKTTTPAWVTNPTGWYAYGSIYIK